MGKEILKFALGREMTMDKKYSKNSLEDFLRYLDGNLSGRERNRIERKLMKDPFEEEAMEGIAGRTPREIKEDLSLIEGRIDKRISRKKPMVWYRLAAAVALLIAGSITVYLVFDERVGQLSRNVAETEKRSENEEMEQPSASEELPSGQQITETQSGITEPGPVVTGEPYNGSEMPPVPEESQPEETTETTQIAEGEEMDIPANEPSEEIDYGSEGNVEEVMAMEAAEAEVMDEAIMEKSPVEMPAQPLAAPLARRVDLAADESIPVEKQRMISGRIRSTADDQPLRGASIMVKGTTTGAVSDRGGNFRIPVNEDSSNILVADFIGMEPKEITVGDQSEMEILLEPDLASLDRVVLVDPGEGRASQPSGFEEYIEKNMQFPENSGLTRAEVILNFTIDLNGRPDNITVIQSPDETFSDEAIRLLNEGPDWNPVPGNEGSYQQPVLVRILFKRGGP